ncbi:hypothetical protein SISSUDRAFT_1046754 [Sistotremastrum suecicum HHB10207 ss-3]|uniref:Cyanovirin-N domain-containing protein n=1 Tax=Sistotremastrum suecicum HHB10207 ss-3 TaxID=1314776 RepID=A0A166DJP3_9AGAM|nr:hypothetical protein SISSUDRAFT_1046754 [Sistotremastrum suecicum HHB10207 ss-3]
MQIVSQGLLLSLGLLLATLHLPLTMGQGYLSSCSSCDETCSGSNCKTTCTCLDVKGTPHSGASINFKSCIANYNGNLACAKNGGYGASCSGCSANAEGVFGQICCTCKDDAKNSHFTCLQTNNCVSNWDGSLGC